MVRWWGKEGGGRERECMKNNRDVEIQKYMKLKNRSRVKWKMEWERLKVRQIRNEWNNRIWKNWKENKCFTKKLIQWGKVNFKTRSSEGCEWEYAERKCDMS